MAKRKDENEARETQLGRPPKFDEPTVRKQFELPVSINERLKAATAISPENPNGLNQADYMRDAVLEKLSGHPSAAHPDVKELVALAVAEALGSTGVAVPLSSEQKERLADLARQLGFGSVAQLLAALAKWALEHPAEAVSQLSGADNTDK